MRPRAVALFVVLAASIGGSIRAASHDDAARSATPTVRPSSAPLPRATPAPGELARGWVGVLVPRETTDLMPRFAGHLAAVHVKVGDVVRRGDVVAVMSEIWQKQEARIAGAARAYAEAEEERQLAEARAAKAHAARIEALAREGLASEDELARARQEAVAADIAARSAAARRAENRARADLAEHSLDATSLRAPFDAVVVARFVDTGAAVDPTTRVVRLGELGSPLLRFATPSTEVGALRPGACVETIDPPARWRIARLAPELDVASHTLTVEAVLDAGAAMPLPFGTTVRVRSCS